MTQMDSTVVNVSLSTMRFGKGHNENVQENRERSQAEKPPLQDAFVRNQNFAESTASFLKRPRANQQKDIPELSRTRSLAASPSCCVLAAKDHTSGSRFRD
jgi:hypothetical protein